MEKKDLMIGDWVQYTQNYYTEKKGVWSEVHYGQVYSVGPLYVKVDRGSVAIEPKIVQPIPLTAEILEKNGFEKICLKSGQVVYSLADDYYDLEVEEITDSIWRIEYFNVEASFPSCRELVSFVHEIQHFLNNHIIEKEIEL